MSGINNALSINSVKKTIKCVNRRRHTIAKQFTMGRSFTTMINRIRLDSITS